MDDTRETGGGGREPTSLYGQRDGLLARLGAIGDRPEDDEHARLQHRFLVYMGLLMSGGGLLWGGISLAGGFPLQSAIPFGYTVATIINLTYFRASKHFASVRFIQVLLSLVLPFAFQWVLGGWVASGIVMLWAMLAIVGSLTFSAGRTVIKWLVVYSALTVVSALTDAWFSERFDIGVDSSTSTAFFATNVVVISNIVFGLTLYLMLQRERAITALESARQRIDGLEKEVEHARKLGQYTLTSKLGEGGMGEVYRAQHAMLRRPTAIKLMRPANLGEEALSRFEREVQLTATLTHPNTVTIFDYGRTDDGTFYYVMEFLDGADLRNIVEHTGAMPAGRVVHVILQAAEALGEAHAAGLIHRDIKPANILLTEIGRVPDVVKLVDFGLVKDLEGNLGGTTLTGVGALAGTPRYMSPEAVSEPDTVDARGDVYALGCVAYYLLVGDHVFEGRTVMEVCAHHLHTAPPPMGPRLGKPIPASLDALVMRCLAKERTERPHTEELIEALQAMVNEPWARWGREDAAAWWAEHGEVVREHQTRDAKDLGETVLEPKAEPKPVPPGDTRVDDGFDAIA